jgi:hypothetical protein
MERTLETHYFGWHQVDVVERVDEDGTSYVVMVDGAVATDPPLADPPGAEDVVRIYARSQGQA